MSAFFPFELEPPPWLYRLLARLPLMQRLYRRVASDLAAALPSHPALLLDIGAGPGHLLAHMAVQRPDLTLIPLDKSLAMLRRPHPPLAGGGARLLRLVGDAAALPLRSNCCDLALATFSFHTWDQPVRGIREMARVVKPRGLVWIYEMNREATRDQLTALAREEALPVALVVVGFKALSWNHALRAGDFDAAFAQAGISAWRLELVHHVFWRASFMPI